MKRDFQLIRKLLLEIECQSNGLNHVKLTDIKNYSKEQIQYHLALLHEAKLIVAYDTTSPAGLGFIVTRLTWEGHEFLDDARNDTIWNKTLHDISKVTESIALPLLRELLTAAIRSQFLPH
jgi:predicted transcriptional regulator